MKALMAQFSKSSMPAPMQLKLGMPKHNDYSWTASFSEAIGLQHPLPTSKLLEQLHLVGPLRTGSVFHPRGDKLL